MGEFLLHLLKGGKSSLPMIISGMFSCEDVLFCVVTEHPDISNTPKANKHGITAMYLDFMLCTSTIFSDFFGFYVIIITLFILNLHKRYNTKHAQNFIFFTKNRWFFKWIMLCKFHSEWCSITFTLKLHLHFYLCQFYFRYSFRNGHKKRHRFFPMPMACK